MKKHREIESEQMLYTLITTIENDAIMAKKTIEINKDLCKKIGVFNYEVRDSKGRYSLTANRLFVIDTVYNGQHCQLIYDEEGRGIAYLTDDDELHLNHKYEQSKKENDSVFKERIIKSLEKSKSFEEEDSIGGEGRSLGHGEHEESQSDKDEKSEKSKTSSQNKNISKPIEEKRKEKLENLLKRKDFSLNDKPKVRLNTIINGYYLWEILGIEEKLKDRMPDGFSSNSFRYGYLTIYTAKEQHDENAKDKLAICTSDGNCIVELDEDIVQQKDLGTKSEQARAQSSAIEYYNGSLIRDGKEEKTTGGYRKREPQNKHDLSSQDLKSRVRYEIPNVSGRFMGVSETWSIAIDENMEMKRNGKFDSTQTSKDLVFVQQSLQETEYNRERGINTLENKLETISEDYIKTNSEREADEKLRSKDTNEAKNTLEDFNTQILEKIKKIYPNWDEHYNEAYLKSTINDFRVRGFNEKEIIDEIGENIEQSTGGRTLWDRMNKRT